MEIRFDLTQDEIEMVRDCAESRGVSMEILIREAILDRLEEDLNETFQRVDLTHMNIEELIRPIRVMFIFT